MSIRVPAGGTQSVPAGGTPRYARLPEPVLHDLRLSVHSRLVYAELALWVFQGRTCSAGARQIAERLGFSKTTVSECIRELRGLGLIAVNKGERGKRSVYVLISPVFGSKQGKQTVVVSAPNGARRMVSVNVEEVA